MHGLPHRCWDCFASLWIVMLSWLRGSRPPESAAGVWWFDEISWGMDDVITGNGLAWSISWIGIFESPDLRYGRQLGASTNWTIAVFNPSASILICTLPCRNRTLWYLLMMANESGQLVIRGIICKSSNTFAGRKISSRTWSANIITIYTITTLYLYWNARG